MRTSVAIILLLTVTIVVGCSTNQPRYKKPPAKRLEPVPELNLNLNGEEEACTAPDEEQGFIEKAFASLRGGDHLEALQYFQRYQRTEQGEVQRYEARIGVAYLIFIPASPVHDLSAARNMYRELRGTSFEDAALHPETLIMRDAMEAFHQLESQIANLEQRNSVLRDDLARRELALKRLREITVGSQQ